LSTFKFLISNYFWLTASRFITKIAALFSLPIITYYLSPKDFGTIAMFSVVQGFLGSFFGMGLHSFAGRVIYKYERSEKEKCREYLSIILIYIALFSITGVIISSIFAEQLAHLLFGDLLLPGRIFYYIPIITAFLASIQGFSSNVLLNLQMNKRLFYLEMLQFILFLPAQLIGLIYFEFTVWDVIILQTFVQAVTFFYGMWLVREWISFSTGRLRIFKEAMAYSLPMVPLNFAGWIQDRIDKVFLNRMVSLGSVGVYSAGVTIANQYSFISRPITTTLKPEISKRLDADSPNIQRDIREIFMFFFQFSIFLYLAISLFSKEIVTIILNARFYEAHKVIPIFLLSIIFSELTGIFHLKFIYKNKTIWFSITFILSALLNVSFNLILIPKFSIYGASLAKTLSELFILFLTYYISQKLHKSSYHLYHNFMPLVGVIFIVFLINSCELWFCKFFILKFVVLLLYIMGFDYFLRKYNNIYNTLRNMFTNKVQGILKKII